MDGPDLASDEARTIRCKVGDEPGYFFGHGERPADQRSALTHRAIGIADRAGAFGKESIVWMEATAAAERIGAFCKRRIRRHGVDADPVLAHFLGHHRDRKSTRLTSSH